MFRILFVSVLFCSLTHAQRAWTAAEIYRGYRDSNVQIFSGGIFKGNGFIVSSDGLILTANHVVTIEPDFKKFASNITVRIFVGGQDKILSARIVTPGNSETRVAYDYCLLKITANRKLPYATIGGWSEVDVADSMVILPSFDEAFPPAMLTATVSMKGIFIGADGKTMINTIMFQAPIRKGFSGAPVFSMKGHVIGIVNTEIFGIARDLDREREKWKSNQSPGAGVSVQIGNADLGSSIVGLINNLDANLISGLGTAVAIDYAKDDIAKYKQ